MTLGVIPYPQIDPVLIDFGFIAIRWYSMAYLGGILFAWWYIRRLSARPGAAMSALHIDDFITWAVFGIILGGRLGYVFFYDFAKYMADPVGIIRFWDGGLTGMSFHGGFAGVVIAVILYVRKHKLDLMRVADTVAIVSPIGLLVGRIANFVNGELWGRPTDVPWAMIFPSDPSGLARHPSQLYEAALEGVVLFLILRVLSNRFKLLQKPGFLAGAFACGYGICRSFVEFFRVPDAHIGYLGGFLTMGILLSIPMILAGIAAMFWATRRAQQAIDA